MIVDEKLRNLQMVVRGGGKLITHRPLFSLDGSTLHIIQSSSLLSYSTKTCLLISKYTTPGSTPIANIHVKLDNTLLIFTQTGCLITLKPPNDVTNTLQIDMSPAGWVPVTNFINALYPLDDSPIHSHFLALGYPQNSALPVLYSVSDGQLTMLCWSVVASQHSVSMSRDGRFVVAIQEDSLFCKDMRDEKNCKWHSAGTRKFTCVAVHPTEQFVCATGDNSGRVLIWNNVMTAQSPAKTVFHWHTLPVVDLAFSPEGTNMFTGGGECTLVKWDSGDATNKRTLPRMGLPIAHVSCSDDGELIAVAHVDNCIQIVDSYNKILGVVKNFTCSVAGEEDGGTFSQAFPCGVNVDPNNGCLVMNGRPGWLQCYDYKRNRNVYDLDVCQQNYVTAEREHQISNAVVTIVGFSKGGGWMGTGESRIGSDGDTSESRLKFWKRDKVKGSWVLNTCVDWPHSTHFGGLRFRPVREDGDVGVVTHGGKQLKVWGVAEVESCHGNSDYWVCTSTKGYKGLDAGPVCYSSDGSLICGAFGRILTVWDAESLAFKLSLCHQRLNKDVKILEFGENVNSHLVLSCSEDHVCVWDVITSSLLWVVPMHVDNVAMDKSSCLVCAASGMDLFLFTLDNSNPRCSFKDASKSKITAVGWLPGRGNELRNFPVFLNQSDEICGLSQDETEEMEVLDVKEDIRLTGYGVMVAEKMISGLRDGKAWGDGGGGGNQRAYSILREIMDSSPHTMPSVKYYCTQLLRSVSSRVNENERLAQMEELAMASGKNQVKPKNKKDSVANNMSSSQSNRLASDHVEDKWKHVNLNELATEDTSWIKHVFK